VHPINFSVPESFMMGLSGKSSEIRQLSHALELLSTLIGTPLESSYAEIHSVHGHIFRQLEHERVGSCSTMTTENMSPLIAAYLARKGFTTRNDIQRLEEAAQGSLAAGICIVMHYFPRRFNQSKTPYLMTPNLPKAVSRQRLSHKVVAAVRALFFEVKRNELASKGHVGVVGEDLEPDMTIPPMILATNSSVLQ
jgi:hypothetical protein